MNRVRILIVGLFVGAVLAACYPQSTTPPAEAVCNAWEPFAASVETFQALDPATAEPGDYQFALVGVRQAFFDLRDAGYEMADANVTALNDAIDDLEGAIDDLPDDTSMAQAAEQLEPELTAVSSALTAIGESPDCPS